VKLYVREKFWLQARNIIDADGNLWTPTKDEVSLDVDDVEDQTAENEYEPSIKRMKKEESRLVGIKDFIDLCDA